ncbi:MAG: hypothetical protein A3C36_07580 [Omnitrophica WOR_2 bacterium RIFCSPHIGHO2_02_FULL_52_10]|nr:MAG: hypothetical protein A3C36_07580 [Omnitrophica WOR_2 bacterium RIFCSPHIGHO2_02_FULL_52_10]
MVKQVVQERRGHMRAKRVLSIQYRLVKSQRKDADHDWLLSTTQDMSPEGLSFYTDREYVKGDILDIHVVMSGVLDVFKGCGEVVRVERKESGACVLAAVRFMDKGQVQYNTRPSGRSLKRHRSQKRI